MAEMTCPTSVTEVNEGVYLLVTHCISARYLLDKSLNLFFYFVAEWEAYEVQDLGDLSAHFPRWRQRQGGGSSARRRSGDCGPLGAMVTSTTKTFFISSFSSHSFFSVDYRLFTHQNLKAAFCTFLCLSPSHRVLVSHQEVSGNRLGDS